MNRTLGHRRIRSTSALGGLLATALLVTACTGGAAPSASSPSSTEPASGASATPSETAAAQTPTVEPVPLTVGLGYIESVQFAQFYLAQQAGYYADAGLEVTLQNKSDPDLITLLGQGAVDIGSGDGTSVIPAVSQGIPVAYTATIYGAFPAVVITRADTGIETAADLKGKRIGTPGRFGTNWIMLQALLQSAGLTLDDVQIIEFPDYGQVTALSQGQVDAVTGFANNEPIQLRNAGIEPVVLTIDEVTPLPGPGLVAGTETVAAKGPALEAFVAATLRAMEEIAADPQKGLDATFALAPDLAQDPELAAQVLDATIETWTNPRTKASYGSIDRDAWEQSIAFMASLGLVPNPVTVDQLVDESLLP